LTVENPAGSEALFSYDLNTRYSFVQLAHPAQKRIRPENPLQQHGLNQDDSNVMKLLAIRMVASSLRGWSRNDRISLFAALPALQLLIVIGREQKKATSDQNQTGEDKERFPKAESTSSVAASRKKR
jgi:hypothetical protein